MDQSRSRNPHAVKNAICRQFINGSCRFGTRCLYLHEWPVVPSAQICRYFQKGGCWYGERCRYLHVRQPDGAAAVEARRGSVPHVYSSCVGNGLPNRRGSEPALPTSRDRRGSESVFNASHLQHTFGHLTSDISEEEGSHGHLLEQDTNSNLTASQESLQTSEMAEAGVSNGRNGQETSSRETTEDGGAAAAPADQEETEAFVQSKDVTCGICMDKVYEKLNSDERRFGILPKCNHSFCLKCIITWRKTKDLREDVTKSCPQCRVKSAFYVPYNYWVEGPAKETLIAAFKEKCSKRRCSYFMRYGRCPFKSECIYRHDPARRRSSSHSYLAEDVEDLDILQLFHLVKAMTLLADLDDDDSDSELPFYIYF
ncbi:makorin, ring finger protein, 4 isoform X2 [Centroberyx gerrardi]|uniref:makorin, ring finger protein, 4 isoform X2 n=1 Tax=Centroberyx gerrardi TaxID=166262 RepID=UPI003AADAC07